MSIDRETDESASIQIGPTSQGMVRIYVIGETMDLPMDFDPEEAEEIAEELRAAAQQARGAQQKGGKPNGGKSSSGKPKGGQNRR